MKITEKLALKIEFDNFAGRFSIAWFLVSFALLYMYSYMMVTQDFASQLNLTFSLSVSILGYLAYLIGREYDPDDTLTAILSQVITTVTVLIIDPTVSINVLVPFFVLLGMRIIRKEENKKLDWFSVAVIFAVVGYLSYTTESWIFFFLLGASFFVDNWVKGKGDVNWMLGLISMTLSVLWMLWKGSIKYVIYIEPLPKYLLALLSGASYFYAIVAKREMKDGKKNKLFYPDRITFARTFTVVASLLVLFYGFSDAFSTITPLIVVVFTYVPVYFFNK